MKSYERLLLNNKAWVEEKLNISPDYFSLLASQQTPAFLWIGCADSRVPANEVTGTHPGEIFVHRNIANMVVHTDFNMLSVLQYAVEVLRVKHVIVCGHYGCGGVKAALSNKDFGLINKWLRNIKDVIRVNQDELDKIEDIEKKYDRLVEMNVKEQVLNLAKTSIIQKSWQKEQRPLLHGWVYGLNDGKIADLIIFGPEDLKDDIYKFNFDDE